MKTWGIVLAALVLAGTGAADNIIHPGADVFGGGAHQSSGFRPAGRLSNPMAAPGLSSADRLQNAQTQAEIDYIGSTMWGFLQDAVVVGNYAYCVTPIGLMIIDVGNPADPQVVSQILLNEEPAHTVDATLEGDVIVSGDYAYVVQGYGRPWATFVDAELYIIDIADPHAPTIAGTLKFYDDKVFFTLAMRGGYIYCPAYNCDSLYVINVSDPRNPSVVKAVKDNEYCGSARVDGNRLFLSGSSLQVWDVSQPENPTFMGEYLPGGYFLSGRVGIKGNTAYCCASPDAGGLHIIDVTDPVHPSLIAVYDTTVSFMDVEIVDDTLYLSEGCRRRAGPYSMGGPGGMRILDIADPTNPEFVGKLSMDHDQTGLAISGDKAYLCGAFGLDVVSVANPASPAFLGRYASFLPLNTQISGNYVYAVTRVPGLSVFDISNQTSPVAVGRLEMPDTVYSLEISGPYAFLASGRKGLTIIDISDPAAPAMIGECPLPGRATGIEVVGNLAYVAAGNAGLQIIDISNPIMPMRVGGYDTPGHAVDVCTHDDLAFVADTSSLQIIDIRESSAPRIVGTCPNPSYWTSTVGVSYLKGFVYVTDYAYNTNSGWLVDISDPTNPSVIDFTPFGAQVALFGDQTMVQHDDWGVGLWDIANLFAPTGVNHSFYFASLDYGGHTPYEGLAVSGDKIYVGYGLGLYAFSVSGIDLPIHVEAAPARLRFSAIRNGEQPAAQYIDLTITGSGSVSWQVTGDVPWLELSPSSGTENNDYITAAVNTTDLAPGLHTAWVTIHCPGADEPEIVIEVEYRVGLAPVVFGDGFDGGPRPEWEQTEGTCDWQAEAGTFRMALTGDQLSCVQSVGDQSWRNYILDLDVRGNGGVDKIVRFRQRDEVARYFVNLRSDWQGQDEVMLGKQVGEEETIFATVSYPSQNEVWYHLTITCVDEHITISIDGSQVISFDDTESRIYAGGIGLVCYTGAYGSCDISFDNVLVTDPFPHVVLEGTPVFEVGDNVAISGTMTYRTGEPYPVNAEDCLVESPGNVQDQTMGVDGDGGFTSGVIGGAEETGTFIMDIAVATGYGTARTYFSFAVDDPALDPPYGDESDDFCRATFPLDLKVDMGQTGALPSQPTQNVSAKPGFWRQYWSNMSSSVVDNFVEPTKDMYRQGASFVTGGWKRTTNSYSGKMLVGVFNAGVENCSVTSGPGMGNCLAAGGAAYALGTGELMSTFSEAFHQLVDIASNPADPILTPEEAARGHVLVDDISMILTVLRMNPTDGGILDAVKTTVNAELLIPKYMELVNKHLNLDLKEGSGADNFETLSFIVVDSANEVMVIGLEPKLENTCVVQSFSPVRVSVTDPRGRVVDWESSQVPGSRYFRLDTDQDGDSSTLFMIPLDTVGPVSVTVVPDASAQPDDSFTVLMDNTYYQSPIALADHMPISAIPPQPLVAETFANLAPDTVEMMTGDGAIFGGFPCLLQWRTAADPNPGHLVTYRVVLARAADYSDSVVISVGTDTIYAVDGALLPMAKNASDTLPFYWRVIASDDWGASSATAFRSFGVSYVCGNANGDGQLNIGDAVYLISYIFRGGPAPVPLGAGDGTCDGRINVGDAVYLVAYVFRGGPAPCCP